MFRCPTSTGRLRHAQARRSACWQGTSQAWLYARLIISSPAARAKATIDAVIKTAKLEGELQFDEAIYGASSAELMTVVRRMRDDISCSLLVGHNPVLKDLVERLTGSHDRMPTAALACIEFQIDRWEDSKMKRTARLADDSEAGSRTERLIEVRDDESVLREQLTELLRGGEAHVKSTPR